MDNMNSLYINQTNHPGGAIETRVSRSNTHIGPRENNHDLKEALRTPGTFEISEGGVKDLGPQIFNTSDFKSSVQGDMLSTLHTKWGSPISDLQKVTDDALVTISGVETTVGVALRAGLLSRDAQGNLIDPTAGKAPSQQQQTEVRKVDLASPKTRQTLNAIKQRIGRGNTDALTARMLADATSGKEDSRALKDFAGELGMEPVRAKSIVDGLVNDIFDNAKSFASRVKGVDGEALFDWVMEECSPAYRASVMNRLYHNDLSVFDEVIKNKRWGNRY